jgi:hypothetical protein
MIRFCRALVLSGLLGLGLLPTAGCAGLNLPSLMPDSLAPDATAPAKAAPSPTPAVVPMATAQSRPTATLPPRATAAAEVSAATLISRALLNQPKEYSFETYSVTIAKNTDKRTDSQGRGFVKGDRYRIELLQGEQFTTIILDGQKNVMDMLMLPKGQKVAVHFTSDVLSKSLQVESRTPREQIESLTRVAWISGKESVDGHPTTIFETRNAGGEILGRYWIWIERGMLVRIERRQPDRTIFVEYMNHVVGPQPDDLFSVPADYKVEDGSAMVQAQNVAKATPTVKR